MRYKQLGDILHVLLGARAVSVVVVTADIVNLFAAGHSFSQIIHSRCLSQLASFPSGKIALKYFVDLL